MRNNLFVFNSYLMKATEFKPKTGASSGGVRVKITGAGFGNVTENIVVRLIPKQPATRKRRSNTASVVIELASMNEIVAVVPATGDGQYEIEVGRPVLFSLIHGLFCSLTSNRLFHGPSEKFRNRA